MGRPIKAHRIWRPVNQSNRPVNRSNRPINRSNRETTFKPLDFLVKTPVTGQTGLVNRLNRSVYRSEPVTHVLLNLDLNSNSFRSNRSGKPLPEVGSLTGLVGFVNPAQDQGITCILHTTCPHVYRYTTSLSALVYTYNCTGHS